MRGRFTKFKLLSALDAVSLLASLLACCACVENIAPAFPVIFLFMLACAAVMDAKRLARPPRLAVNLLSLAILVVMALRLRFNYIFEALIEALLLLLGVESLEKRTPRVLAQILGISFALPVACTSVSVGKSFALYAAGTGILCSLGLTMLLWLKRDENAEVSPKELWQLVKRSLVIFAFVIPVAVLVFFAAPRAEAPMFGMRGRYASTSTGFTDEVDLGAASDIETSRELAFRVEMEELPGTPYWRGRILDVFTGGGWMSSNMAAERGAFSSARGAKLYRQTFYLEPAYTRSLFALDRPLGLSGVDADDEGGATYSFRGFSRSRRLRYTALSVNSRLMKPREADFDRLRYLSYPRGAMPKLEALAARLTAGKNSLGKMDAIMKYLAPPRFSYSLKDLPHARNALEDFVFDSRRGSCEYFASAMAAMLRMSGVPARLVGGYRGGIYNEAGGYYSVLDENAHAWVEAWDEEQKAWVRCDPTPAGEDFGLSQSQSLAGMYLDYLDYQWSRLVLGYSWELQTSAYEKIKAAFRDPASTLPKTKDALQNALKVLRLPVIAFILAAALIWLLRELRKISRRSPAAVLLAGFDAAVRKQGYARKPSEGLEEFAARIDRPELRAPAAQFAQLFESRYFTDRPFDADVVAQLKELTAQIKRGGKSRIST